MVKRKGFRLMATQDFSVKFSGPAVAEGRMPVADLAPSLLALGELFQRARDIAEPEAPPVNLEIRALAPGSFEAFLGVSTTVVQFLTSNPVTALNNLLSVVMSGRSGVIAAVRALRGQDVVRTEPVGDQVRAYNNEGNTFVAPHSVFKIYNNYFARDAAVRFVEPLRKPGLTSLDANAAVDDPIVVTHDEVLEIEAPIHEEMPATSPDIDQTFETLVTIIQPSLEEGYMWRVNYAGHRIRASFEDEDYLGKIQRREVGFVAGDTLKVDIRMRQWAAEGKTTTRWSIVRVHGHSHPSDTQDTALPFSQLGESEPIEEPATDDSET